jgi:hypothetical protein
MRANSVLCVVRIDFSFPTRHTALILLPYIFTTLDVSKIVFGKIFGSNDEVTEDVMIWLRVKNIQTLKEGIDALVS